MLELLLLGGALGSWVGAWMYGSAAKAAADRVVRALEKKHAEEIERRDAEIRRLRRMVFDPQPGLATRKPTKGYGTPLKEPLSRPSDAPPQRRRDDDTYYAPPNVQSGGGNSGGSGGFVIINVESGPAPRRADPAPSVPAEVRPSTTNEDFVTGGSFGGGESRTGGSFGFSSSSSSDSGSSSSSSDSGGGGGSGE